MVLKGFNRFLSADGMLILIIFCDTIRGVIPAVTLNRIFCIFRKIRVGGKTGLIRLILLLFPGSLGAVCILGVMFFGRRLYIVLTTRAGGQKGGAPLVTPTVAVVIYFE